MTNESYSHVQLRCGTKTLWKSILICILAIFCVLRELIFAIRTDWFLSYLNSSYVSGVSVCIFEALWLCIFVCWDVCCKSQ